MKYALVMSVLNDFPFLNAHLPAMLQSGAFDGIVCIDGDSTDGSRNVVKDAAALFHIPADIKIVPWAWDFARQQNHALSYAEAIGYDAIFKWDPDELLFAAHLRQARQLLEQHIALVVPRFNFEERRDRYCPMMYPDWQIRFFRLNRGIFWTKRLHAGTNVLDLFGYDGNSQPRHEHPVLYVPSFPIYHYEGIRPLKDRALKWRNYQLIQNGQTPLEAWPENEPLPAYPVRFSIPFVGDQPIQDIRPHYPYEEPTHVQNAR